PAAAALRSQPAEKNLSPPPVTIATRRAGSSRKRAKASPIARLVAASIAFAFGRSSTTSKMAPSRVMRRGDSVKRTLPDEINEHIGGDGAQPVRPHHQRIDVEFQQPIDVTQHEGLNRQDRREECIPIASRLAAVA